MKTLNTFKETNKEHWKDATYSLIYNLGGGLMPVWGGMLILIMFGKWGGFEKFFIHGEFAIYSATLLAPSYYLIQKNNKRPLNIFKLIIFLGLLINAILFAGVSVNDVFTPIQIRFDILFLVYATLSTFVVSIFILFFTQLFDNARISPNIEEIKSEEMKSLDDDFSKLGGK